MYNVSLPYRSILIALVGRLMLTPVGARTSSRKSWIRRSGGGRCPVRSLLCSAYRRKRSEASCITCTSASWLPFRGGGTSYPFDTSLTAVMYQDIYNIREVYHQTWCKKVWCISYIIKYYINMLFADIHTNQTMKVVWIHLLNCFPIISQATVSYKVVTV